jgi:hypothetical protein
MKRGSKTILIRSKDRINSQESSTTSSDFVITSRDLLDGEYEVVTVVIPNTTFNIHASNSTITLIETAPIGSFLIGIEPGNYTAPELSSVLQLAFNGVGTQTFTVSLNSITGKLNISSPSTFRLSFPNSETSKTYGFVGTLLTPAQTQIISPNVVSLGHPESIGISIKELITSRSAFENIATRASADVYVPLSDQFGFYKSLMSTDLYQSLHFNRNNTLSITVVDPSTNQIVDLNGSDWEMLLKQV